MSQIAEWLDAVGAWAWDRHHNILSWYVRPLFLIPFCWFAYRRNLWGIAATLVALATSMAWFPAPDRPSAAVIEMLDAEKEYLFGDWTPLKIGASLLIPVMFTALALALWRRSMVWGLVVINGGVLFKVVWTFVVSGTDGAMAHLVPALLGLAVVDAAFVAAIMLIRRRRRRQPADAAPAPAERARVEVR
jgi:hypothetical protein